LRKVKCLYRCNRRQNETKRIKIIPKEAKRNNIQLLPFFGDEHPELSPLEELYSPRAVPLRAYAEGKHFSQGDNSGCSTTKKSNNRFIITKRHCLKFDKNNNRVSVYITLILTLNCYFYRILGVF